MKRLMLLATLVVVASAPAPALATPEDTANDIASKIMSPYCPGVTLHDCPSDQAIELRERIVAWATAGWSQERILDTLEKEFGPQIRAVPPTEGGGLLAWVLPAAAVAAGAALAWTIARRWSSRTRPGTAVPPATEEDRRRLDAELARLRGIERW
ncbi:MAG: cytochrome c-type biogenesis protein [Actinomycetota bacterium]